MKRLPQIPVGGPSSATEPPNTGCPLTSVALSQCCHKLCKLTTEKRVFVGTKWKVTTPRLRKVLVAEMRAQTRFLETSETTL